jgi:pyruvate dehydrogenase E2 component (dihydrolipoamide acetyltransferase)
MPFTLTMPKLSPTMEAGTIVKWTKKVGDFIKADEVLFEVATDKATVEHTVLDDGFLREILVPNGQEARVGQAVAVFSETKDEDISSYKPEGVPEEKKAEKVSTPDKPSVEEKVISKAPVTSSIQQPAFTPEEPLASSDFPFPVGVATSHIRATPYAKKLAKEKGLDLSTVKGSGPNQRILARDIDLGQPLASVTFGNREVPTIAPGTYEEEALSPMRKVIAQRLQQSKSWIPHFYVTQEMDADAMIAVREQLKAGGLKITFNDLVIRATALALKEHPEVNSGFNSVSNSIIRFKTVDISVAVSVPDGLITPIVRHADYKNLGQISVEVKSLADKAKKGKLSREEYVGGSFTISNLGMFGITEFKGIINPPQAAILCVSGIVEKPVVRNGQVVPGKTITMTLSVDHRVVDGADGAKFMKTLQKYLENPSLLLI